MSDSTVYSAVMAKRADAESKRLRALATVWELESAERHALLLQTILRDYAQQYIDSVTEASYFERILVKRNMHQLENDADFTVAAYTHDLMACHIANLQLDHLEDIGAERELSLGDFDIRNVECRFHKCLDGILGGVETLVGST